MMWHSVSKKLQVQMNILLTKYQNNHRQGPKHWTSTLHIAHISFPLKETEIPKWKITKCWHQNPNHQKPIIRQLTPWIIKKLWTLPPLLLTRLDNWVKFTYRSYIELRIEEHTISHYTKLPKWNKLQTNI